MVRDVAFGQYFPANSVIHKCDPRAKLIMLVGFLVIIFCTFNYASLALVVLFTALFVAASKVPAKFYFKSMKVIIFIIIVTSILNVFYGSGDPLVQWGIFKITLNGIRSEESSVLSLQAPVLHSQPLRQSLRTQSKD